MALLGQLSGLDIAEAGEGESANFDILGQRPENDDLLRRHPNLDSASLAALARARCFFLFRADAGSVIQRATVYLPLSLDPPAYRHCTAEETTQALGLPDDDPRAMASIFNDATSFETLPAFDRVLVRLLYAPSLSAGMARGASMQAARQALDSLLRD